MGSCSSAKKDASHSQAVEHHTGKNNLNLKKISASTTHTVNGSINLNNGDELVRRKSKLKEFERISKETILDGKIFLKLKI